MGYSEQDEYMIFFFFWNLRTPYLEVPKLPDPTSDPKKKKKISKDSLNYTSSELSVTGSSSASSLPTSTLWN